MDITDICEVLKFIWKTFLILEYLFSKDVIGCSPIFPLIVQSSL